jgi:cell division septal protein FtsQ
MKSLNKIKTRLLLVGQILVVVTAFGGLGWGAYKIVHYLRTAPRFEVNALAISGIDSPLKRVSENQIIRQAEFEVGTNVFHADLNAIRERVERLDWVRHAIVQRVLPDQIIIKVVEREPIGLARISGEVYQFDADARILELDAVSDVSFPILDGLRRNDPEGNLKKVGIYQQVLEELGETELSEVHINPAHEVAVVSASDPLVVNLGSSEFRTRWIKYLQLKTQIRQQYPQAVKVDLRFKNQVIVRMRDDDNSGEQLTWDGAKKSL